MSQPVKLQDVIDALEMAADETSYYLDKRTGEIEMITNEIWGAVEDDEPVEDYPEWQREAILKAKEIWDGEEYFEKLPGKFEINSYEIMERFCQTYPNQRVSERLSDAIRAKGAYRRFKDLVFDLGIQDKWNRFEHFAYEQIAIEWLEDKGIPFVRGDEIELEDEM
jgi:Uncharacterised protein family (UPF0158)